MEKTLVVLAAGMGSRFGGLKQIEPVGPSGEIIADYSVYDAIKCGFTKVVFIIKQENLTYFRENITSKYQDKIKVEFAFQSLADFQDKVPATRTKMLGTAHALYCARTLVHEPFIMINADDYYGLESFKIASSFLDTSKDDYEYLSVSYPFINSTTDTGKVNRGLITEESGIITDIEECSIEEVNGEVIATSKQDGTKVKIDAYHPVSMNFLVFKPTIFDLLKDDLDEFLKEKIDDKKELILTDTIKRNVKNKKITFKTITTSSHWLGMTYKEDLPKVKEAINNLIKEGIYPDNLWR